MHDGPRSSRHHPRRRKLDAHLRRREHYCLGSHRQNRTGRSTFDNHAAHSHTAATGRQRPGSHSPGSPDGVPADRFAAAWTAFSRVAGVARVLFIYNDPTAPAAMLGTTRRPGASTSTSARVRRGAGLPPTRWTMTWWCHCSGSAHDPAHGAWVTPDGIGAPRGGRRRPGCWASASAGSWWPRRSAAPSARPRSPELGWYTVDSQVPSIPAHGSSGTGSLDPACRCRRDARNDNASQAFLSGSALALQFHLELDPRCWSCGWPRTATRQSPDRASTSMPCVPAPAPNAMPPRPG